MGTLNAHLLCLDARSGVLKWDVVVADNKLGYGITGAPLAVNNKIIVGISGGEAGIRGFRCIWCDHRQKESGIFILFLQRENLVTKHGKEIAGKPAAHQPGVTGSYDKELNLLYWGIGNPGLDWNTDHRAGDNLYTCSVLAINPETGKLAWHFQFTPHDTHDWDANQIPVLIDVKVGGVLRRYWPLQTEMVLLCAGPKTGEIHCRQGLRKTNMGQRPRLHR